MCVGLKIFLYLHVCRSSLSSYSNQNGLTPYSFHTPYSTLFSLIFQGRQIRRPLTTQAGFFLVTSRRPHPLHPFTWQVPTAPLDQVPEAWPGCPASSRMQCLWPERFLWTRAPLPQDRAVTGWQSASGPPQSTAAPPSTETS